MIFQTTLADIELLPEGDDVSCRAKNSWNANWTLHITSIIGIVTLFKGHS